MEPLLVVAALYVDPRGPYPRLPGVECWDGQIPIRRTQARDARLYAGPRPVVAHPPCQLWVNYAALNYKRYGGEHNRPGNDGGCFAHALKSVLTYGGVLEHPADSKAWRAFDLTPPPRSIGWSSVSGAGANYHVCEVWQSAYGHKARKRTWLLWASPEPFRSPFELDWRREPGTHQVGWFDRKKPTLSKKLSSRTPESFARELVRLARAAGGSG